MHVILVPFIGEAHHRTALTAPYPVARALRPHTTGLFARPEPVHAIGVVQGIPAETVERVTRPARASWNERAALARPASDRASASADAALADRPTDTDTVTVHRSKATGAADVLPAGHGHHDMAALVAH
jgi:hypothetical protein